MGSPPLIAIVGRPNVGKSALFNRICGKRIAIVDAAEGVTRDRLAADAECFGKHFRVVDTGGIDARSSAPFNTEVLAQALTGMDEADALIFVVDGQIGPTELDYQVLDRLRRSGKPFSLAINKVDTGSAEALKLEFHRFGLQSSFCISAIHGRGVPELLESVLATVERGAADEEPPTVKLAVIGRPNVGKSTLVNQWLGTGRMVVSSLAGTTRDSVDTQLLFDEKPITLIDTAGIRKRRARESVDKYALLRTQSAIERADTCVLTLDAQSGLTSFEKRIATMVEAAGKACVLLVNKWDLMQGVRMEHCVLEIRERVPFLKHCPLIFASAKSGRNCDKVLRSALEVFEAGKEHITTSALNRFIESVQQNLAPPMVLGKRLRIYYLTQVGKSPPRFLLFINQRRLLAESYRRYLYNQFRKAFGFRGNPILLELKDKKPPQR